MSIAKNIRDLLQPSTKESLIANDPKAKRVGNKFFYLKSDVPVFSPPLDKKQKVRIMPIPKSGGYFAHHVRVHFNVGPNKESTACPFMRNEKCPACVYARELFSSQDKDTKELAKDYMAKTYHLAYVIDRANPEKGPQIWSFSTTTLQELHGLCTDPDDGTHRPIDSIESGFDVYFTKGKETDKAQYNTINGIVLSGSSSKLGDSRELEDSWIEYIVDHPIDLLLNYMPSATIEAHVRGLDPGDVEQVIKDRDDALATKIGDINDTSAFGATNITSDDRQALLDRLKAIRPQQ